jgi:hypothetical protein
MRVALKVVTMLLALSFLGSLQTRAEWCEPASASCQHAQPMECCRPGHCHCDLSAPSRSASNPAPSRATAVSGREVMKIASAPFAMTLPGSGEHSRSGATARVDASPCAVPPSYLFTHAFLI